MTCNLSIKYIIMIFLVFILYGCSSGNSDKSSDAYIADHTVARLSVLESIPDPAIENTKSDLVIAYGHTSHGSQIRTGMDDLDDFMGGTGLYSFFDISDGHSPAAGVLDFRDFYSNFGGSSANDLGNPDLITWESATRTYLNSHPEVNVIVWSWCGQVSSASESDILNYLSRMTGLEDDYPDVKFVYMTGHLDGTGLTGNLHLRNEQIRKYCRDNDKILFDFADIESYDPDGTYYGTKNPDDACNYVGGNWATEWQTANPGGWYSCSSAHSQPVNANMKAYAFWWLMARIAGWDN